MRAFNHHRHLSYRVDRPGRRLALIALAFGMSAIGACDRTGPPAVAGGDAAQGKALLTQYQCGACHRIGGLPGARGNTGPSLESLGRSSYLAGRIPNDPEALVRWIMDPPAMKPGTLMPAMGVSAGEARHMAAYLYTRQ